MIEKLMNLLPDEEYDDIFRALLAIAIENEEFNIDEWEDINYETLADVVDSKIRDRELPEYLDSEGLYARERDYHYGEVEWELRNFNYLFYVDISEIVDNIMDDFYPRELDYVIYFEYQPYYVEKE